MTLVEQITFDITDLKEYFHNIDRINIEPLQQPLYNFRQYIKSDKISNIYSLLDFWLDKLCNLYQVSNQTNSYKSIKKSKKDSLFIYNFYLTNHIGLNLTLAQKSYDYLQNVRLVRNCIIHNGGHSSEILSKSNIHGISTTFSLVTMSDEFLSNAIKHTECYLIEIARQYKSL